jgi:hypothetical protein
MSTLSTPTELGTVLAKRLFDSQNPHVRRTVTGGQADIIRPA